MIVERVATDHQPPFVRSEELSSFSPSRYWGCAQLRQSVGGSEIVHHAATAPFSLRSPASTPALAVWYRFHRRNPARHPRCPLEIQRPNRPDHAHDIAERNVVSLPLLKRLFRSL